MIDKQKFLRKIPIFAFISDKELDYIASISRIRDCSKDENIFSEKEIANTLFIIVQGMVKIVRSSGEGRVKTLAILGSGDFFGEMALVEQECRSASARAMKDSQLLVISRCDFEAILKKYPSISHELMKILSQRLREADREIENLSFQNVLARLAIALMDLAEKHGTQTSRGIEIQLELTHQELAEMVGTAREVVSRILLSFKKNKCIAIDRRTITIIDKDELRSMV